MQYRFPIDIDRQRLHYTRGDIDANFTRTSAVLNFGNMFIQTGNDKKGFWLNWDLKSLKPDMVSMVDFTDVTNPLFIRKGNPNLKNALKFAADMSYQFSFKISRAISCASALISTSRTTPCHTATLTILQRVPAPAVITMSKAI